MKHSARQYAEALIDALHGKEDKERLAVLRRFVRLLRRKGDNRQLKRIAVQYEKYLLKREKRVKLEVSSPEALSDKTRKALKEAVGKDLLLIEKIDPSLLAGIQILLDDTVLIDATGRRMLETLFDTTK